MADVLRTLARLAPSVTPSVRLVEVSPKLRAEQAAALGGEGEGVTRWGGELTWHPSLHEVPQAFSFFLLHEFLDALPVHRYERTEQGWREVLVDLDPAREEWRGPGLRWVISRHATPSCALLEGRQDLEGVTRTELSTAAGAVVAEVGRRVVEEGGAALVVDYGEEGAGERDTVRAYRRHKQVDPLVRAGEMCLIAGAMVT